MKPAPEEFGSLRKLLALKRHESPPPGYFDRLSAGVRARIEAAERAPKASWWQQWLATFDAKPILVGAYGVALVGLVMIGVNIAQRPGNPRANGSATATTPANAPAITAVASATNNSSTSAPPSFLTNPGTGTFASPPTPAGFTPNPK